MKKQEEEKARGSGKYAWMVFKCNRTGEESAVTPLSVLALILFIMSGVMPRQIDRHYANLLPN